jgi:hypothetical protein
LIRYDVYSYDFTFAVRGKEDVYVGLYPNSDLELSEHMYLINIGGKSNTYTAMRKGVYGVDQASVESTDMLDEEIATRFRVSVDFETGSITLKKWKDYVWVNVLTWMDEEPLEINYIAISSGSSTADWWFDF